MEKSPKPLVLCGKIFTATGEPPIENGCVVIEGKEIKDVGSRGAVEIPKDAEVIELPGHTIMPGLIDSHIHITGLR
ncbi:MAG: hypothetical protein DRO12_06255, partial [Thermoprotei archaeon]